jgi:hypothetical protein
MGRDQKGKDHISERDFEILICLRENMNSRRLSLDTKTLTLQN